MTLLLKQIISIFAVNERKKIIFLMAGILLMAAIEVVAVASIMPFMMLVMNPQLIQDNSLLNTVFNWFAFSSSQTFLLCLGACVFLTIVLGNAFSAFMSWKTIRFSYQQGQILSLKLFEHYLNKPFEFFIANNSSELAKNILYEVNRFVTGLLLPLMQMLVKGMVSLFILAMLFYIDPLLASVLTVLLGGTYTIIYLMIKKRLGVWGTHASALNAKRFKLISEAFEAIKELKINRKENYYLKNFDVASKGLSNIEAKQQNAPQLTRYLLEAAAFGGILLVVMYLTGFKKEISQTIPLLALYAFSGYRLMPALQQIFSGMSLARYNYVALEILIKEFNTPAYLQVKSNQKLNIENTIYLNNISYFYPGSPTPSLDEINMNIHMNTLIGFVGKTGSGKSTLAHILTGLLLPTQGDMRVDTTPIDNNLIVQLQKSIGYVPQTIFITDNTIMHNIAFGLEDNEIDFYAVQEAAVLANIHEFIMTLPEGYQTIVGERGIRLSGGQRQRIGIARSLYHKPQLLIFDEATSALDAITEQNVISEIVKLRKKMTIVIIAHRMSTVKACDNIYLFDNGKVIAQGTYDELSSLSVFQKMSNA
ncbi:MAG: ABC transporter ATP-binding protein [Proteobacteria bacterium]|nr:ABC transporter ATP-binding protein [Pseudomonadota bacterium]